MIEIDYVALVHTLTSYLNHRHTIEVELFMRRASSSRHGLGREERLARVRL
jgi:hypothetical protein